MTQEEIEAAILDLQTRLNSAESSATELAQRVLELEMIILQYQMYFQFPTPSGLSQEQIDSINAVAVAAIPDMVSRIPANSTVKRSFLAQSVDTAAQQAALSSQCEKYNESQKVMSRLSADKYVAERSQGDPEKEKMWRQYADETIEAAEKTGGVAFFGAGTGVKQEECPCGECVKKTEKE